MIPKGDIFTKYLHLLPHPHSLCPPNIKYREKKCSQEWRLQKAGLSRVWVRQYLLGSEGYGKQSAEMLRGNYNCSLPFLFFLFLSCHWFFLLGVGVFSEAIVTVNDFSLLAIITFVPGDCSRLSGLWQALTAISSFLLCTNFLGGAQKKILFHSFFPSFSACLLSLFSASGLPSLGALPQEGSVLGRLVEKPTARCGAIGCQRERKHLLGRSTLAFVIHAMFGPSSASPLIPQLLWRKEGIIVVIL